MSEHGKKSSICIGEPIQRVKRRLRENDSTMTLSARLNQIVLRYLEFVVDGPFPDFTGEELDTIREALQGIEVTPAVIRGLDGLVDDDGLATKIQYLTNVEKLRLVEQFDM